MFFYILLIPISTTSGLWSTGNTRNTSKSTYTFTSVFLMDEDSLSIITLEPHGIFGSNVAY